MAKIAIVSLGFHGHVNPTLGVAEALKARGHAVVYLTSTEFISKVRAVGASFRPFAEGLSVSMRSMAGRGVDSAERHAVFVREMEKAFTELKTAIADEDPDLILYGFLFPEALEIAAQKKIPAVRYFTTYALNESIDAAQLLRSNTTTPNDPRNKAFWEKMSKPAPTSLVFLPRAFQPFAETFDATYHFVGPCIRNHETGGEDVSFANPDDPLIVVSLGTIFHDHPEFYKMCVEIFRDRDVRVAMAVGSVAALAALPPLPPNIVARAHLPQLRLLSEAALFIFHGGMNSTMEALFYGVPLVVVPQMEEQELTARRVTDLGLGLALNRETLTPELLEEALDEIMADPSFRERALAMRQEIRRSGGADQAVTILEGRLAASQRSKRSVNSCRTLSGMDTPSDAIPGST